MHTLFHVHRAFALCFCIVHVSVAFTDCLGVDVAAASVSRPAAVNKRYKIICVRR